MTLISTAIKVTAASMPRARVVSTRAGASSPPPSRRSVFLASGMSPLLRLASSGAAFAAGSGQVNLVARAATSEIAKVLLDPKYPPEYPFGEKEMQRYDESSDFIFYSQPRFVRHIDDDAIRALTEYYASVFPPSGNDDVAILDVCSSWISHYPEGYAAGRISGLGMNEDELKKNPVLTDYVVRDLNENPELPYEDNTFDVVTNAVSVDYLTRPLEMMKEVRRVLKPGGLAIMSFSNRCFPTKAVSIWTATGDLDHIWIVGAYFHYAGGFEAPAAEDISPKPGKTDPMYVVFARKEA